MTANILVEEGSSRLGDVRFAVAASPAAAASGDWNALHGFAIELGGVWGCIGGFVMFRITHALPIDWIGKAILDATAIVWRILLGTDIRRQTG